MAIPKENEIYRHFKGNRYKVLHLAKHTETGEEMVIYQGLDSDGQVYARPLDMFLEPVDKIKYPEAVQTMRFELEASGEEKAETGGLEPLVLEFLDSDSYEEKMNILAALHHKITDDMINTLAVALDVEIPQGDVEKRYEELKCCLLTLEKYECNRMR